MVGPGAIGCAFAATAVQAGRSLVFGARTPFDRLQVDFPDVAVDEPVDVLLDPAEARPVPLVLLATKTHQTEAAAPWLDGFTDEGTVVVSLQNGVDHRRRVDPLLGPGVISLPAVVACAAQRAAPGRATVSDHAQLHVPAGEAADRLIAALDDSKASVRAVDDWETVAWTKLMTNAAMGGIGVLTRRDNRVFHDEEARELALGIMEEVAAVGRAEGADLGPDLADRLLEIVMARAGEHVSSIVADRLADRPTEWRDRNEVVVRLADAHGIDVPLSRVVTTLLRLGEPADDEDPVPPEAGSGT
ncbi:MAG: 2-dehydropantoate 2-reductase [Actinomycetota bacterium]